MSERNCLVLSQHRNNCSYNDFIGKYYHFPCNNQKNYSSFFENRPIEFVYFEPSTRGGKGVFFGYGKIDKPHFADNREEGYAFVEISSFKPFSKPVAAKNSLGEVIEKIANPNTYNSSNAVRTISENFLDGVCLDGGILLNIESDAHLVRVLGEQLIGSEKIGVLELVKNAIDANAKKCRVRIEQIPCLANPNVDVERPDLPGPVIIIEDDGEGMTREIIEKGWLRPASTLKTNIKQKLTEERARAKENGNLSTYNALYDKLKQEHGRIPLGEKGVGRFATHRLGNFLELCTKTKGQDYELIMKIDWRKFDAISDVAVDLNSIGISLFRRNPTKDYGEAGSGTTLTIYGGREGFFWNENIINELNGALLSLNSPIPTEFKGNHASNDESTQNIPFEAIFECPQIELKSNLPYEGSLPNFALDAIVDDDGIADYELAFKHPQGEIPDEEMNGDGFDLRLPSDKTEDKNYWFDETGKIKRSTDCGSFFVNIKVWYRKKEWIDIPEHKDLTDYLSNFGGIAVYRDGILVRESSVGTMTDWLGLSESHIRQAFRISYRDMIGYVDISQKKNILIQDRTSREGFIENRAYKDLCVLLRNLIEKILLPPYMRKRDDYTQLKKGLITDGKQLEQLAKTGERFFSNITNSDYPMATDPYKFFDTLWDSVEDRQGGIVNLQGSMKQLHSSIKMLEDVQDIFVEQAGFGIAVAVSLHELNKIVSNFYHGVNDIIKSKKFNDVQLSDLKASSQSLRSELNRLSPLRAVRNESPVEFPISRSIEFAHSVYKRRMEEYGISFDIINPEEDFKIYGRYGTMNQVFCNLFDNAIYWIRYAMPEKKRIVVFLNLEHRNLIFADSGFGVSEIIRPSLFQPGYSLKVPPSGLGLYICKMYLSNMKARIYETPEKDREELSGAQFTLDFKKTPSENTVE